MSHGLRPALFRCVCTDLGHKLYPCPHDPVSRCDFCGLYVCETCSISMAMAEYTQFMCVVCFLLHHPDYEIPKETTK